jgi:hypothetical protein
VSWRLGEGLYELRSFGDRNCDNFSRISHGFWLCCGHSSHYHMYLLILTFSKRDFVRSHSPAVAQEPATLPCDLRGTTCTCTRIRLHACASVGPCAVGRFLAVRRRGVGHSCGTRPNESWRRSSRVGRLDSRARRERRSYAQARKANPARSPPLTARLEVRRSRCDVEVVWASASMEFWTLNSFVAVDAKGRTG